MSGPRTILPTLTLGQGPGLVLTHGSLPPNSVQPYRFHVAKGDVGWFKFVPDTAGGGDLGPFTASISKNTGDGGGPAVKGTYSGRQTGADQPFGNYGGNQMKLDPGEWYINVWAQDGGKHTFVLGHQGV